MTIGAMSSADQKSLAVRYLESLGGAAPDAGALAYFASLDQIRTVDPLIADSITQELVDQRSNIKLIASENYSSLAVQLAQGNLLTDKYAEGIAGRRFYAGCDNVDTIENHGADLAKQLFGAQHAYLQPHSGIDANLVAFLAILATRVEAGIIDRFDGKNASSLDPVQWAHLRGAVTNQRLMALDYYSGGHLTHGYRMNVSARLFDVSSYSVDRETKLLDLDTIHAQAREVRPLILLAGYSAYSRLIDFAAMRQIADEVGAVLMVDMAHFAGLVAGKVMTGNYDPVQHAHIVTTTTHKTLRGPRGGMVLCDSEFAEAVDKGCPAVLGGPLSHAMAAKAVAFKEALAPSFQNYAQHIVSNAQALAEQLQQRKCEVLTGGTDNHIVLADVAASYGITGRQAEKALRTVGLTLNRNSLPFDENGAWYTSGLRLGTPAVTTLGMGVDQMAEIADIATTVLAEVRPTVDAEGKASLAKYVLDEAVALRARARVAELLGDFPLYPQINLGAVAGPAGKQAT